MDCKTPFFVVGTYTPVRNIIEPFSIFVLVELGLNASSEETPTKVCENFNIRGFHLGIRYFPNVMNG